MWQWNMKTQKRKAIVAKIVDKTHTSSKTVLQSTLPYLKVIFNKNREEAKKIAEYFDLDKEEIAYLSV